MYCGHRCTKLLLKCLDLNKVICGKLYYFYLNGGQNVLPAGKGVQSYHRDVFVSSCRQKLPNQYFQSYSKVWNSFSKWCRAQLEQDRIILASDFRNSFSIQFNSHLNSSLKITPKSPSSVFSKNS